MCTYKRATPNNEGRFIFEYQTHTAVINYVYTVNMANHTATFIFAFMSITLSVYDSRTISLAIAQTYPLPAAPDVMHHQHTGREGLVQRATFEFELRRIRED